MIQTKEDLRKYIREDSISNNIISFKQYIVRLLFNAENARVVRYLRTLRHQEYYFNNQIGLNRIIYIWYKFKTTRLSAKYNIGICINTVGYGLKIPHLIGGVIINCKSMGNYCIVNGGVVIGRKNDNEEIAVIGNNVEFCVGCKIIGKITIGDNVVIAPNSVLTKSAPKNTIWGGIPAKQLKFK